MTENVRTKCIIFGEAIRIRVKKFKHNLPENYSKSPKIAITACKLSKIFRETCPRTPLQLFFFLRAKKMWKLCPPLLKFLPTPLPALVVGEKIWSLVLAFPHYRNASAIAAQSNTNSNALAHLATQITKYQPGPSALLLQATKVTP